MKKILFSIIMLISIVNIYSQNPHYEYGFINHPTTSAVTIIHSDNFGYILSTEANNINVSRVDPTNMQPIDTTYTVHSNLFKDIKFKGAFEDNCQNLVAYGIANTGILTYYIIFKIQNNFTGEQILYDNITYCNGIIEGCSGYDTNGVEVNLFLLETGEVFFTDCHYDSVSNNYLQSGLNGVITDISWNSYQKQFVASGLYKDIINYYNDPFLIYFQCTMNNLNFINIHPFRISSQSPYQYAEGRTLHEVIDENNIVICQDLRKDTVDYIWLTLLDQNIIKSRMFYFYPYQKLYNYDMKYDKLSNLLTILGRTVPCYDGINFIAQIDPYELLQLNVAQIRNPNSPNFQCPGTNYEENQIFLKRLELNPYNQCRTILSTGKYCSLIYITETDDINLTHCDNILNVKFDTLTPTIDNMTYQIHQFNSASVDIPIFSYNLILEKFDPCFELFQCPSKGNLNDEIFLKNNLEPEITIFDNNKFIVKNFTEKLHYYIYDITGKLLINGETECDKVNIINNLINGFYILQIENSKGEKLVKKFTFSN